MSKFGQRMLVYASLVVLTLVAMVSPFMAQSNRGTITGTVTDPSGARGCGGHCYCHQYRDKRPHHSDKRDRRGLIPSRSCRWGSTS